MKANRLSLALHLLVLHKKFNTPINVLELPCSVALEFIRWCEIYDTGG